MGNLFNLNVNEICKFQTGRLRPYFLQACKGTLTTEMCFDDLNQAKYVEWWKGDLCANADEKELLEARKSFLSGHASYSFYNAMFLVFYLQIRFCSQQYQALFRDSNKINSRWARNISEVRKKNIEAITN